MGAEGGSAMGKVTDSDRVGHGRPGFLPVGRASDARVRVASDGTC